MRCVHGADGRPPRRTYPRVPNECQVGGATKGQLLLRFMFFPDAFFFIPLKGKRLPVGRRSILSASPCYAYGSPRTGGGGATFGQHLESLWPQVGLHRAGRPCPQVQAYTYFGTCFCGNTYGDRMVSGLHQLRAACAAQETRLRCAVQMLTTASMMFHSGCPKKASRGEMSKSVASTSDGCRWSVGVHRRHTTLFRRPEGARRPASMLHPPGN